MVAAGDPVRPAALARTCGLARLLAQAPPRAGARIPALVVLVGAYATAATVNPPAMPLWHGLVLLLLVAAWLWLPGLGRRDALAGGALVLRGRDDWAAAGRPARRRASVVRLADLGLGLVEGRGRRVVHLGPVYGPLDWPRSGKALLEVKSNAPHYWRTAVLNEFDGFRWLQSVESTGGGFELPRQAGRSGVAPDLSKLDQAWLHRIRFTVDSLSSPLVIGAGTVVSIHGLFGITPTSGGLILPADDPLTDGDSTPSEPTSRTRPRQQMVASPPRYPHGLTHYTRIELPQGGSTTVPLRGGARQSAARPHAGTGAQAAASGLLSDSPYRGMYGLAHRLTDSQPTSYDAVNAVEDYLGATTPTARGRRSTGTRCGPSCSRTDAVTVSSSPARWR